MERYVCIHGHFYQPPRENPWLEEVELQDSAYPYHDWNERICAECYAPNAASRILDGDRRIIDIVNNYSKISFNFGPTLLAWMERRQPSVLQAIIEADAISRERFSNHGAALAQVYNHMIMPLANRRDKITQALWGIADFQKRFGRDPEGMWLPETAVDLESLDILAELGILFTVLAPRQADKVRQIGQEDWIDVSGGRIDPTMPYRCMLPSGRSIAIFFYDGPMSRDVAFGGLLDNGEKFAWRLMEGFSDQRSDDSQLVHIATDGETYGHHHRQGDMALAYCLYYLESQNLAQVTIYGEYLEKYPERHEVQIFENSSWSCIHGVERWRENCGCNSGMNPGWTQEWRKPLRQAMDRLTYSIIPFYEKEASRVFKDCWEVRDAYIQVILDRRREKVEEFLNRHAAPELTREEKTRALKLLEMQRHSMLMLTSCGWFFDEVSGIEATQVMRYAARVLQFVNEFWALPLERDFMDTLAYAPTNIPEFMHGARIYEMFARDASVDLLRVGAHYAISSLIEDELLQAAIFCYSAECAFCEFLRAGTLKMVMGKTRIFSNTTWDERLLEFAALYLGDHNVVCGIQESQDEEDFERAQVEIRRALDLGDIPELIRLLGNHFGSESFTLWHLFKDEQQKVLKEILRAAMEEIQFYFRQTVERHYTIMNFLSTIQMPLPKPLAVTAECILDMDFRKSLQEEPPNLELFEKLIDESKRWSIKLDTAALSHIAGQRINELMVRIGEEPENFSLMEILLRLFELLKRLQLTLDLWKAQNTYFIVARERYPEISIKTAEEDSQLIRWLEAFRKLGDYLHVKVI